MDVELSRRYPELAVVARATTGESLHELADRGAPPYPWQSLETSLYWVREGMPRAGAAEPHGYLATLNEFFRVFPAARNAKWIGKLVRSTERTSYLDTVLEAAVALHGEARGWKPRLDAPLGRADGKDSDLFLSVDGREMHVDCSSVDPENPRGGIGAVVTTAAKRKYRRKFARVPGIEHQVVGVVIGLSKCDAYVKPRALLNRLCGRNLEADDESLWSSCPSLGRVWACDLEPGVGSEVLEVNWICDWRRPTWTDASTI